MQPYPSSDTTHHDEDAGLRETFLVNLHAEERRSLDARARRAIQLSRETHSCSPFEGCSIVQDMRAAARDLYHLQGFLRGVGAQADHDFVDRAGFRLSDLADVLAVQLAEIAQQIEAAIERGGTRAS